MATNSSRALETLSRSVSRVSSGVLSGCFGFAISLAVYVAALTVVGMLAHCRVLTR